MSRRAVMIVVALAIAVTPLVLPAGVLSGAGAEGANASPALANAMAHIPAGGGGGGGVEPFDVGTLATLNVTTTADDGSVGSLRQVIEVQAVNVGGDVVVLEAGATYVLTCAQGGDIDHGNTPLEIQGNGATIRMAPGCNERLLENGSGATVLRDVWITGNDITFTAFQLGALIRSQGSLTLFGGAVSDNTIHSGAFEVDGLLLTQNSASFEATGTAFVNNLQFTEDNCAIVCSYGDARFTSTVFSGNRNESTTGGYICGTVACASRDVELVDSYVADSFNQGEGGCGGIGCTGGDVILTRTTVVNMTMNATGDEGICGAIACSSGGFQMTDSSVTGTSVSDLDSEICGAIACLSDDMVVVRSTISDTSVTLTDDGGGNSCGSIVCTSGGMRVVNSTVARNVTTGGAALLGAFTVVDPYEFVYATFVGNTGSGIPALADYDEESVEMETFASVFTGSGPGGTCATTVDVTSSGYNFADDTTCDLTGTGDRQANGADALLGPLTDNGGPGPTMEPTSTSPLVDAVPAAACQSDGAAGITTDERSLPRPSSLGPNCDIGAVELQPAPVLAPTFTG